MSPLILAALVAGVLTAEAATDFSKCPTPATQSNFDLDKYLGLWHEMMVVEQPYEKNGACGTAHYSWKDPATKAEVNVINSDYLTDQRVQNEINLLAVPDDLTNGKFFVRFPVAGSTINAPYWVLGTDYDTYAVVYSCMNEKADRIANVAIWVLSRSVEKFANGGETAAMQVLRNSNLPTDGSSVEVFYRLHRRDQYCPEGSTCKPCSKTQANLDLNKLKGRWWAVQQAPFASGAGMTSCGVVDMAAADGGISATLHTTMMGKDSKYSDVEKTLKAKWVNSTTKDGEFMVTDGLNKGSTDRLCVVGTDYDNWAVISVCGEPMKPSVTTTPNPFIGPLTPATTGGLWLLSRKRGLTAAQQMEANKVILSAGIPASVMQNTPTTPCPAKVLTGAASATTTAPVVMAFAVLATLARMA